MTDIAKKSNGHIKNEHIANILNKFKKLIIKIVFKFTTSFSSLRFLYKFLILEQKQVCGL